MSWTNKNLVEIYQNLYFIVFITSLEIAEYIHFKIILIPVIFSFFWANLRPKFWNPNDTLCCLSNQRLGTMLLLDNTHIKHRLENFWSKFMEWQKTSTISWSTKAFCSIYIFFSGFWKLIFLTTIIKCKLCTWVRVSSVKLYLMKFPKFVLKLSLSYTILVNKFLTFEVLKQEICQIYKVAFVNQKWWNYIMGHSKTT